MPVETYEQLYQRIKTAAERRQKNYPKEHRQVLTALDTAAMPWQDDDIMKMAAHLGFQELLPKEGVSIGRGEEEEEVILIGTRGRSKEGCGVRGGRAGEGREGCRGGEGDGRMDGWKDGG